MWNNAISSPNPTGIPCTPEISLSNALNFSGGETLTPPMDDALISHQLRGRGEKRRRRQVAMMALKMMVVVLSCEDPSTPP